MSDTANKPNSGEAPAARAIPHTVRVLGSGCAYCNAMEAAAREAVGRLGMDVAVEHIKDRAVISAYGIIRTPALAVDGRVVSAGKDLTVDDIVELLKKSWKLED